MSSGQHVIFITISYCIPRIWLCQEGHPIVKTLLQYSSLTLLEKECYKEEVQPYWKTDYKPMIYIVLTCFVGTVQCSYHSFVVHSPGLVHSPGFVHSPGPARSLGPAHTQTAAVHNPLQVVHSSAAVHTPAVVAHSNLVGHMIQT